MKKFFTIAIFALSFNAFAQISSNELIAWYPFFENCVDASGNGNNGSIVGGINLSTDRFGNTNYAYSFDGQQLTYINCGSNSSFDINSGSLSISAWIKPENGGSLGLSAIVAKASSMTTNVYGTYELSLENMVPKFTITNLNAIPTWYTQCSANDTLEYSKWYHLVAIADSANQELKLYINGQLSNSITWGGTYHGGLQKLLIGCNFKTDFGNQYMYNFMGGIDDVRLYRRAVNSNEIQFLFNEGLCYQTITVTDTLIINANLTGFNPVTYQNSIKIYPNPASDHITIDFGSNYSTMNGYTLKITNSLSQIVYTTPINTQFTFVDLSTWIGNGIYFVHLIDALSNTIDIRKIVLQ